MKALLIPEEKIESKIFFIRSRKIMLDRDLAEMYDVETRSLIQAVKRNLYRFPEDFMFQLNSEENKNLRSQFVISSWGGRRYFPYAFTEQGVAMLSSVLNSRRAIEVNIQIMRTFTKLRKMIANQKELREKLKELELKINKHDSDIQSIFNVIHKLTSIDEKPKRKIGFVVQ